MNRPFSGSFRLDTFTTSEAKMFPFVIIEQNSINLILVYLIRAELWFNPNNKFHLEMAKVDTTTDNFVEIGLFQDSLRRVFRKFN